MQELNSGTEVPGWPEVRYLTLRGTADTNASRTDTAKLEGADKNALFHGLDHYTVITDPAPQETVRDFIIEHGGANGGGTEPPPAGAPSNLSASNATQDSVSLTWTAASGASGYNVYRSTSSGGPWTQANSSLVGGTSYTVSGLSPDTTYYFVVRAQRSDGSESENSNQISRKTEGGGATEQVTAAVYEHFIAQRITVNEYITLGTRYGYGATLTLYQCPTGWTDKENCEAL